MRHIRHQRPNSRHQRHQRRIKGASKAGIKGIQGIKGMQGACRRPRGRPPPTAALASRVGCRGASTRPLHAHAHTPHATTTDTRQQHPHNHAYAHASRVSCSSTRCSSASRARSAAAAQCHSDRTCSSMSPMQHRMVAPHTPHTTNHTPHTTHHTTQHLNTGPRASNQICPKCATRSPRNRAPDGSKVNAAQYHSDRTCSSMSPT